MQIVSSGGLIVLRHRHLDARDATVHESTFTLPADVGTLIGVAIRKIMVDHQGFTIPTGYGTPKVTAAISTVQGMTGIPCYSNPGTIMAYFHELYLMEVATSTAAGAHEERPPGGILDYTPIPLIVVDKVLSLYTLCEGQTATPGWFHLAMYYELVKLTQNEFMAAMSVMESL
ncbi:hypothetical protein ES703_96660 [subsurface metagenome]